MSFWKDLDIGWKRVGGVIAAVTALSAITVTVTGWEPQKVTACYILAGLVTVASGWMLDRHAKEFEELYEDRDKRLNAIEAHLQDIKQHSIETRKDTLRIQLASYMKDQPKNVDTILLLAEKYFCELDGDWYMTSEFMNWCEANNIKPEIALSCKVKKD